MKGTTNIMDLLNYSLRAVILKMQHNIYLFLVLIDALSLSCRPSPLVGHVVQARGLRCAKRQKCIRRIVVPPSILANASLIVGSAQHFANKLSVSLDDAMRMSGA